MLVSSQMSLCLLLDKPSEAIPCIGLQEICRMDQTVADVLGRAARVLRVGAGVLLDKSQTVLAIPPSHTGIARLKMGSSAELEPLGAPHGAPIPTVSIPRGDLAP